MSRRNQSNRRKSYGRRQHELRERHDRRQVPEGFELELDAWTSSAQVDPLGFVDPRRARLHFAAE
jgi:hypothetical protein